MHMIEKNGEDPVESCRKAVLLKKKETVLVGKNK